MRCHIRPEYTQQNVFDCVKCCFLEEKAHDLTRRNTQDRDSLCGGFLLEKLFPELTFFWLLVEILTVVLGKICHKILMKKISNRMQFSKHYLALLYGMTAGHLWCDLFLLRLLR